MWVGAGVRWVAASEGTRASAVALHSRHIRSASAASAADTRSTYADGYPS